MPRQEANLTNLCGGELIEEINKHLGTAAERLKKNGRGQTLNITIKLDKAKVRDQVEVGHKVFLKEAAPAEATRSFAYLASNNKLEVDVTEDPKSEHGQKVLPMERQ